MAKDAAAKFIPVLPPKSSDIANYMNFVRSYLNIQMANTENGFDIFLARK